MDAAGTALTLQTDRLHLHLHPASRSGHRCLPFAGRQRSATCACSTGAMASEAHPERARAACCACCRGHGIPGPTTRCSCPSTACRPPPSSLSGLRGWAGPRWCRSSGASRRAATARNDAGLAELPPPTTSRPSTARMNRERSSGSTPCRASITGVHRRFKSRPAGELSVIARPATTAAAARRRQLPLASPSGNPDLARAALRLLVHDQCDAPGTRAQPQRWHPALQPVEHGPGAAPGLPGPHSVGRVMPRRHPAADGGGMRSPTRAGGRSGLAR